jgi:hypothetical protein
MPSGEVSEDIGEAEVAAAEAAIEGKHAGDSQAAIGNEDQLVIAPVTHIPEVPIEDPVIDELAIPPVPPSSL